MAPKISIIVPVYNTGKILKKTLSSIKKQTFKEFECIIVDDGSTDQNTIILCNNFVASDSRFRYISKINEGIEKTRIFGVTQALSDLLVFCDHDDFYEPEALHVLYNAFLNSNAEIVVANCWQRRFYNFKVGQKLIEPCVNEELILDSSTFIPKYFINFFGVNKFPVSTWGKLYKKKLFSENVNCFGVNFIEDIILNVQIFERANIIHFIPHGVYTHIYGGLSSTFNFVTVIDGYDKIYTFRKNYLDKCNLQHTPLLIEFKNVINQNIDLLIDSNVDKEEFVEKMKHIVSKGIFKELSNNLNKVNDSEYLNLLNAENYEILYSFANSKNNLKRKIKHLVKRKIQSL